MYDLSYLKSKILLDFIKSYWILDQLTRTQGTIYITMIYANSIHHHCFLLELLHEFRGLSAKPNAKNQKPADEVREKVETYNELFSSSNPIQAEIPGQEDIEVYGDGNGRWDYCDIANPTPV